MRGRGFKFSAWGLGIGFRVQGRGFPGVLLMKRGFRVQTTGFRLQPGRSNLCFRFVGLNN